MKNFSYVEVEGMYHHAFYKMWRDNGPLSDVDIANIRIAIDLYKLSNACSDYNSMISTVLDDCGILHEIIEPDQIIRI